MRLTLHNGFFLLGLLTGVLLVVSAERRRTR
jgi:hypothetical protein